MPRSLPLLVPMLAALAGACARYTPAPLDPMVVAEELESRNRSAPGVAEFLAEHGSSGAAEGWSVTDFVLAAFYYSPQLDRLRAEWRAAQAGAVIAGARQRPDLEAEVGYGATGGDALESRWVAALAAVFSLELGGKRGARIAAARARAARAEVELEAAAWTITHSVRAAAGEWAAARARLGDMQAERQLRDSLAAAAAARYAWGERRRTELAILQTAAVEAAAAEAERAGEEMRARTALASAIGLPVGGIAGPAFTLEGPDDCGPMDHPEHLRRAAIRSRPEVGRALASYAVAEADLRLAVAGSYPDLRLGPGFTWDEGVGRWSLLLALPRLPVDRNRGPIAQALHRRDAAAAAVAEAELQVITDLAEVLEACLATRGELMAAEPALAAAQAQAAAVRASFQRGEAGAEDTLGAQLPIVRAGAAATAARHRIAMAALRYQRALGIWVAGDVRQPDPRRPPRGESPR
jgi:outer membrane protein TolC